MTSHHKKLFDLAFDFINEMMDGFRKNNNSKLMLRYHHLLEYVVEHRPTDDTPIKLK
jgi:hypothetical protein